MFLFLIRNSGWFWRTNSITWIILDDKCCVVENHGFIKRTSPLFQNYEIWWMLDSNLLLYCNLLWIIGEKRILSILLIYLHCNQKITMSGESNYGSNLILRLVMWPRGKFRCHQHYSWILCELKARESDY